MYVLTDTRTIYHTRAALSKLVAAYSFCYNPADATTPRPKQNFFREEVIAMVESILHWAANVLAQIIGRFIYEHLFGNRSRRH